MDKSTIYQIIIGAIAGYLGGMLYKGQTLGLLGNIVVGIIGGVIGGVLFKLLNLQIQTGFIGTLVVSTVGAIVTLFVIQQMSGRSRRR